jgi:hypothetical protein
MKVYINKNNNRKINEINNLKNKQYKRKKKRNLLRALVTITICIAKRIM